MVFVSGCYEYTIKHIFLFLINIHVDADTSYEQTILHTLRVIMSFLKLRYLVSFLFFLSSDLVLASGEVLKCRRSDNLSAKKMRCLIVYNQELKVRNPQQVVVKDKHGYWVATGKVYKAARNGVIGVFPSSAAIQQGHKATFKSDVGQNTIDYDSAFN